jgi:FkbH-like protein
MRISKDTKKNKKKIKIAILGGSTTDLIKNNLSKQFTANNFKVDFYESGYNQFYFEGIKPTKKLKNFNPDYIYIHTSTFNIDEFPSVGANKQTTEKLIKKNLNKYKSIWSSIKKTFDCYIIQNNFEFPVFNSLGNLDSSKIFGKINYINKLNAKLFEYAQGNKNLIIQDINYMSSQMGLEKWNNDTFFFNYKYVLSHEAIEALTKNIFKIIESIYGNSKKCLILDFDNTIWGGVVGEVGWKNLEIGNSSPLGEVYLRFQNYIKELMNRGIIIAGCTKNNYDVAMSAFKNKYNILKKENFSVIKANWENKAKNIIEISKELNINLNSMVFIDDSKFERELVKKQLPMIEIPDIGNDPEKYIYHLDRGKYFENINLSNEDLARTKYYKRNLNRENEKIKFKSYDQYLTTLKSQSNLMSFSIDNFDRIVQLTNKTNQFNLTTKRMTLKEIKAISKNPKFITITADLSDKFGENGIVTILVGKIKNDVININQWLMSCRVFNRKLEFAVFDHLVKFCRKKGIKKILGSYVKTTKNSIVENFFKTLMFKQITKNNNGSKWSYNIPKKYTNINKIIKIKNDK